MLVVHHQLENAAPPAKPQPTCIMVHCDITLYYPLSAVVAALTANVASDSPLLPHHLHARHNVVEADSAFLMPTCLPIEANRVLLTYDGHRRSDRTQF